MNSQPDPDHTSTATHFERTALARRRLFRGGAVLAGSAAVAAVITPTASAANGDPVRLGASNTAASPTTVQIGGNDTGSTSAALALENGNGPTLQLQALDESWDEPLEVGQIVNRTTGPVIGVDQGSGPENTYLALGTDIQQLPVPYAFAPVRLLDTRNAALRENVLRTSSGAFASDYRLKAGHWLDLAILPADDIVSVQAVYANLTATASTAAGYLVGYPPGDRPVPASSLNYAKGQTVANSGFFAVDVTDDHFAFRIYASGTTHVILDVTGYTLSQQPGPLVSTGRRQAARTARRAGSPMKFAKTLGRGR